MQKLMRFFATDFMGRLPGSTLPAARARLEQFFSEWMRTGQLKEPAGRSY
jgi:hypothetical protein